MFLIMITNNLKKYGLATFLGAMLAFAAAGLVLPSSLHAQGALGEDGWEEMYNDEGIRGWRKEVAGSPVVAFRGEAVIDAPIGKVAQVLSDSSRKTEWVHRTVEARNLEIISELERFEYNHTAMPAILTDREFVFHAKVELDRPKRQVRIAFASADHPAAPVTKYVRGKLLTSRYIMTSLGDGSKTQLMVEIHTDPMGSVPKWLINLFQKSWPKNTLKGIRKQVAKADVPELTRVREFFDGKIKGAPDVVTAADAARLGLTKK